MKTKAIHLQLFFVLLIILSGCKKRPVQEEDKPLVNKPAVSAVVATKMNRYLARTVNLGNALEAPQEGEWGMIIQKSYIDSIAAAGFTAVRVPIKWSAHAQTEPPYTIDASFFSRIDEVTGWALDAGLSVIVDFHHYNELTTAPAVYKERWLSLWKQIAAHYKETPERVFFELLNEPNSALTAELWNRYLREAIPLIRKTNPTRMIIVGPEHWNAFNYLDSLALPPDTLLIATFHYYLPFHFTHQGADWVDGSDAWLGTTWQGTADEKKKITDDFTVAARWREKYNRPLFLGEFGTYSKADSLSRILWTSFVRQTAESNHFSWAYWEFGAGFGIYDRQKNQWRPGLLHALIPE